MKVDKSKAKDIVEEYEYIIEQLTFIGSFLPWDVPPNVQKCRDIRHDRLIRRLKRLVNSEEGKDYKLFIEFYRY